MPDIDKVVSSLIDEDGRLHLYFDTDVVFHFSGNKQEMVKGLSLDFSTSKVVSTVYDHHTNPVYSKQLDEVLNNPVVSAHIKYKTEKFYSKVGRPDYKRIAKENMFNNRLKSKGCSCND